MGEGGKKKLGFLCFLLGKFREPWGCPQGKVLGTCLVSAQCVGKSQGSGSSCLQLSSQVIANSQAELWKNEQLLSWQPQSHDIAVGRGQVDIH